MTTPRHPAEILHQVALHLAPRDSRRGGYGLTKAVLERWLTTRAAGRGPPQPMDAQISATLRYGNASTLDSIQPQRSSGWSSSCGKIEEWLPKKHVRSSRSRALTHEFLSNRGRNGLPECLETKGWSRRHMPSCKEVAYLVSSGELVETAWANREPVRPRPCRPGSSLQFSSRTRFRPGSTRSESRSPPGSRLLWSTPATTW